MPCSDGGRFREEEEAEDNRHMRAGAELLCTMCRGAEKTGLLPLFPAEITLWWYEHKKRDER